MEYNVIYQKTRINAPLIGDILNVAVGDIITYSNNKGSRILGIVSDINVKKQTLRVEASVIGKYTLRGAKILPFKTVLKVTRPKEEKECPPLPEELPVQDLDPDLVEEKLPPNWDERLPPPGSSFQKTHKGVKHEIYVFEDGFVWQGTKYKSLSRIATEISGQKNISGFIFFKLT